MMQQDWLNNVASALQRPTDDPLVTRIVTLIEGVQSGKLPPQQAQATLERDLSSAGAGPVLSFAGSTVQGSVSLRDVAGRDIITITVVQLPPPPPLAAPFFAPYPQPTKNTLVGRSQLLASVRERLCQSEAVRMVLEGMPGVGKTRLATELAYDIQLRTYFSGGVFMTSLGQQPDLEDRLNQWARALGIELQARLNLSERVELFAAALTRGGKPCLIIIDDVWTTEHARALLFGSPLATFLLTSRQRDQLVAPVAYDQLLGFSNMLAVPPLEVDDAATLLQQQAGLTNTTIHRAELEALAALVGGLPLLLNAMGGQLAEVRQQEDWFAKVLNELQQASARLNLPVRSIEQTRTNMRGGWLAHLRRKPIEKALSASAVIDMSMAHLPHNAKELFIRLAALPSDPLSFAIDAAREVWEHADDKALRLLVQRNLLTTTSDGRFRMHRMLWDWAESKHYRAITSARRQLADWHAKLPTADYGEEFQAWAKHSDNWQHLLQTWRNALDDPDALRNCIRTIVPMLIQYGYWNAVLEGLEQALRMFKRVDRRLAAAINLHLGNIYYQRAEYQQARSHAADALRGFQEVRSFSGQAAAYSLHGLIDSSTGDYVSAQSAYEASLDLTPQENEHNYASCLNNLAKLLEVQGDYAAARSLYERALQIFEQVLGPTHPNTASSLNNLAGLLEAQGDAATAQSLYKRILQIREQVLGPTHPDTASSLNNLAGLLEAQGDAAAAQPLHERALQIKEHALGPTHPDTAISLNNLAKLLEAQGNYTTARPLYERALEIREQALGPTHPDTAISLNNLAKLLEAQGYYAAARPLYERALQIFEQVLGPSHRNTASSLNNLAGLLEAQGDYAAARPLYERALQISEQVLGPTHPNTAANLNNLAKLLEAQGNAAAAQPLHERALEIKEQVLGPTHPDTATSLNDLARLLQAQGNYTAARPLHERALEIREQTLGPIHPDTANSLNNLAALIHAQGDATAAQPLYERALQIREQVLGPIHPGTAESLSNLAGLLHAQGDHTAARPLYERALQIFEQVLPTHPNTATNLNNLAKLLEAQGDAAAAQALVERALEIREQALGATHPDTATSLNNLARLLQAQGNYATAQPLYERALQIREQVVGPIHPDTATSLHQLAVLLRVQGDYATAQPLFERALLIREQALGPVHPDTASSLNSLAVLLYAQGDSPAAQPLVERALQIKEQVLGPTHPDTLVVRQNLAGLLSQMGPDNQAAESD